MKSHLAPSVSSDTLSWRSTEKGTIFIQVLIEQFRNHACDSNLQEIFRKVRLCSYLQVCRQMQPYQWSEVLLRAEFRTGHFPARSVKKRSGLAWKVSWHPAMGWACKSLACWCSPRHLMPPDTHLGTPLGTLPNSLHPSNAGHGAALMCSRCRSHPRCNTPLKSSLGSCHH